MYIFAGRIVSLAAMAVTAVNIMLVVRNLGGTLPFGLLAGILFVETITKGYVDYVGTDEPQFLAHAVMTSGLAVLTVAPKSPRHVAAAALLMVTAGFIKDNIFAAPLAVTTWLLQTDRRALRYCLGCCVGLLALGFAVADAVYGAAFFAQLRYPRTYSLYNVLILLGWLQNFIIPLMLWVVFASQAKRDPRILFVSHLVAAGGYRLCGHPLRRQCQHQLHVRLDHRNVDRRGCRDFPDWRGLLFPPLRSAGHTRSNRGSALSAGDPAAAERVAGAHVHEFME